MRHVCQNQRTGMRRIDKPDRNDEKNELHRIDGVLGVREPGQCNRRNREHACPELERRGLGMRHVFARCGIIQLQDHDDERGYIRDQNWDVTQRHTVDAGCPIIRLDRAHDHNHHAAQLDLCDVNQTELQTAFEVGLNMRTSKSEIGAQHDAEAQERLVGLEAQHGPEGAEYGR